ncbi:DUF4132 domain-containing protein [Thermopolyspora sp. NPDC052614]|uniref:DUF4132 domain-containing protein n=1 Tax=Thermopolyspora sp. NPDC052614 TaxID=3155682 RepID=UPI00341F5A37
MDLATAGTPALPDEDTLVMPDHWHRQVHVRRGGRSGAGQAQDPAYGGAEFSAELRETVERVLGSPVTDPSLGECGRAQLRGEASPLGAAVVALAGRAVDGMWPGWVAEHGLAFAAGAFVELVGLAAVTDYSLDQSMRDGVRYAEPFDLKHGSPSWDVGVLRSMRALIAAADEQAYQEVVERLAEHRGTAVGRVVVSYLVPGRTDWVDECCAEYAYLGRVSSLLIYALGTARHVELLDGRLTPSTPEEIATLMDGLGVAVAPLLAVGLAEYHLHPERRRGLLDALALVPSDEAFRVLLDLADETLVRGPLLTAMRRFPERGLRLLAQAAGGSEGTGASGASGAEKSRWAALVAELLGAQVRAHPELTRVVLPGLPEESRTAIETIQRADAARLPDASVEALPPLLTAPPWTRRRKVGKPVVIAGLTPPAGQVVRWAPGERERWAKGAYRYSGGRTQEDWDKLLEDVQAGVTLYESQRQSLVIGGPLDRVRPLLDDWQPRGRNWAYDGDWLWPVAARFELEALPLVLRMANLVIDGGLLVPFLDARVAALMVEPLMRMKRTRKLVLAWLERHGVETVPYLVPAALGKPGASRRAATQALRLVAADIGLAEVVEAARVHGDKAAAAIEPILAMDPVDVLPAKVPDPAPWAEPWMLPQVRLRGDGCALPTAAVGHVLTMLTMSKPGEVYAGVEVVRELCDPGSLAEFSWAVFEAWRADGMPPQDGWALQQLGWLGDDETVRRLTPVIHAWPGESGHSKAVAGLDALAAIGTDVALMHLYGIAQKAQFKGLKTRAQEKVAEVAEGLGLTSEQLADRLVPDFGLDAGGGMVLDYGPRRFVVGFDEQLTPYVADEDGKRRASLPKPGVKDDPELAPEAYKRFATLKKDVRTAAADQVRRLEAAMVSGRRWSTSEFAEFFVAHPLLWHITRRLVWTAEHDGVSTAFRVAEDRTYADVEDEVLTLPESARVGIAHPVTLGEALTGWSQVFADYEIMQPFPQLGRAVHVLAEEERASGALRRFEKTRVSLGALRGLVLRGWEWGEPRDAGLCFSIAREVVPGRFVVLGWDQGIRIHDEDADSEATITCVWNGDRPDGHRPDRDTPWTFGELDPVTASELLIELTEAIAPAD